MKGKKKQPARTFIFRITPERMTRIWRVIELTEKQTLHNLHTALYKSFGFTGNSLYTFYLSDKPWDSDSEYAGPSASGSRKAIKAELGKLKLEKGKSFLYVYNFEKEKWFMVEWVGEDIAVPKVSYPRVLEEEDNLPPEEVPLEEMLPSSLKPWAAKFKPIVETWLLLPAKARTPKEVQEVNALLKEIYQILAKQGPGVWPLLEACSGMHLVDWLLSLPADFVKRGLTEEALALCDYFAPLADPQYFLCEKALVYVQMGRRERALRQIRDNLTQSPENPRVIAKSAEAFWILEEVGPAERLFRKALDLTCENINDRECILKDFVAMLEENERMEEVIELIRSELDRG